jgi:hypothetical protein
LGSEAWPSRTPSNGREFGDPLMGRTAAPPRRLRAVALFLCGAAVLGVAYSQAPLYYSNQNQYFLHGLAEAGHDLLAKDWLAGTLDPTPVFSGLVALTARFLHPWAFHVYHALLLGAYAAALVGLFFTVAGERTAARRWPVFVALLVAVHAALTRWLSYRLFGLDYPWYLQTGLATQYVLGAMFQPSVFGVLLVMAVCLFVRGRPFLAGACVAAAATVHSTYLLPGALLTLGFLAALVREGQVRKAVALAALTLVLVLPVTAYVLLTFGPTSAEAFAQAQRILVEFRIPHHTMPELWFDHIAGLQVAWMVLAVLLVRRTRLFLVLAVPFALMVLLTLVQVATGSDTLALLFPWRVSAVLVPVATAVILSRLIALPSLPLDGSAARVVSGAVVAVLVAGGVWIMVARQGFGSGVEEDSLIDFVRRTRQAGDVYFVPVNAPRLVKTVRGGLSSDFKLPAEKRTDARLIPADLQGFRLSAGVPIFVDFKAIPYKDGEVIEWRRRIALAEKVQDQIRKGQLKEALDELKRERVTHLIWPAEKELSGPGLEKVPGAPDGPYRLYRLGTAEYRQGRAGRRGGRWVQARPEVRGAGRVSSGEFRN